MRTAVKKSLLALAVTSMVASPVAKATSGYFAHGYGTAEKGLAGAGTAYSQGALAAATNPAGMAFIGSRMDLGMALFNASPRGHTVTGAPSAQNGDPVFIGPIGLGTCQYRVGTSCEPPFSVNPGSYESINELFLVPFFGRNWQLNDSAALGFSFYGNGGLNTEFTSGSATLAQEVATNLFRIVDDVPGTFGAGETGVNLEQLFFNFSFAQKVNATDAIGLSLLVAAQRFAAEGLGNFESFSLSPEKLTSGQHSYSYGAGFKLGYQGDIVDGVRFGASYQSIIQMSKFDEYAGLFAGGGEFDIPSTYNVGVAIDIGKTGVFVLDVQRINYTDAKSFGNSIASLRDGSCTDELNATLIDSAAAGSLVESPARGAGCLGGSNGAGFGWQDVTIVKIGYQFDMGDMTYRFGYSHTGEIIPESEVLFNILAPATLEHHYTAGLTARIGTNQEFSLSGMVAPRGSVKGDNFFDDGDTQIEIELFQWELEAGWSWKY